MIPLIRILGEIKLISGGTFTGAANVLKNEPNGKIGTITGGTFTMDNQEQHFWGGNNVLQNYGTIDSITGGAFRAIGSSDDGYLIAGQPNPAARYGITNYGMIGEMGGDVSVSVAGNSRAVYVAYSSSVGGTSSLNITGRHLRRHSRRGDRTEYLPPRCDHGQLRTGGSEHFRRLFPAISRPGPPMA